MNAMPQPSIAEERTFALRTSARGWRRDKLISDEQRRAIESRATTRWRRVGLILGIVLFVLTLQALGALYAFSMFLSQVTASMAGRSNPNRLPSGIVTLLVAIPLAELLIRRAKFFGMGIESALWIGGLSIFISSLPSQGKPEALLVFAAAAAIAGWRVLNPLFGTVAVILVATYVAVKVDGWWAVLLFCLAIAAASLFAIGRRIERPSNEWLFSALAVLMAPAGYLAVKIKTERMHTEWRLAVAMAVIAAIFFAAGAIRRGRAELFAGALASVAVLFDLQLDLQWAIQTKLIVAGVALVAIASILSRLLRGKAAGFVVTPTALTRYDEAMQIGGAIAVASPGHAAAAPPRESGGGSFGGAGASGDF